LWLDRRPNVGDRGARLEGELLLGVLELLLADEVAVVLYD